MFVVISDGVRTKTTRPSCIKSTKKNKNNETCVRKQISFVLLCSWIFVAIVVWWFVSLEAQFGEEPFVFARLVFLFEFDACLEAMYLALGWIFKIFRGHLLEWNIRNTVSGWHNVIVVQKLQNTMKTNE